METKKQKISHYELLIRVRDKTKIEYERTLTKEASTKHYWKTASPDLSKSEVKILKLEYRKARLRRKAKKLSVEIAELRLKAWAKTHDIEEKIYILSENGESDYTETVTAEEISRKDGKKSEKKSKSFVTIVIEPTDSAKPSKENKVTKTKKAVKAPPVEIEAIKPPKQSRKPAVKPAEIEAVEPAKSGRKPAQIAQDLTIIEGIGNKLNEIFKAAGISTFEQLATSNEGDIKKILVDNKMSFANPTSMIEQAKLAAAGKTEDLEILKAELKGGRKKK
jgi:predicted flap endonuclease-1-like 5' DNA nuclease